MCLAHGAGKACYTAAHMFIYALRRKTGVKKTRSDAIWDLAAGMDLGTATFHSSWEDSGGIGRDSGSSWEDRGDLSAEI